MAEKERQVDSLQRVNAVIIALAIGQGVKNVMVNKPAEGLVHLKDLPLNLSYLWVFLAVLVPLYHSMTRHLERRYIEPAQPIPGRGALLLFDFSVFLVEACLLFAVSITIPPPQRTSTFKVIAVVVVIHVLWSFITYAVHDRAETDPALKTGAIWGALINAVALGIGIYVYFDFQGKEGLGWVLGFLASGKALTEYVVRRQYYFPTP